MMNSKMIQAILYYYELPNSGIFLEQVLHQETNCYMFLCGYKCALNALKNCMCKLQESIDKKSAPMLVSSCSSSDTQNFCSDDYGLPYTFMYKIDAKEIFSSKGSSHYISKES